MSDPRDVFQIRGEGTGSEPDPTKRVPPSERRIELDGSFFVDIGCATWKLHQRMFHTDTGEARNEFRQLARHVATIRDRFSDLGLQIQDHTGNPYDSGQSLEVLAFQPTVGIATEIVIETVRPSLYLREHRILKGQVIVGVPVGNQEGSK